MTTGKTIALTRQTFVGKVMSLFFNMLSGLIKAMVFPVVMCGCESWTKRKLSAEELMLLNCGVGEDSFFY